MAGILNTAQAMRDSGHETEIVCFDEPGATWLSDIPFKTHALGPKTKAYSFAPKLAPWLRRHAEDYDAVFAHGPWNYATVGAWLGLAGKKLPFFVFAHGGLDPWHRREYPVKNLAKQFFWWAVEGRALGAADAVLFTSEDERRLAAIQYRGYEARLINYGIRDVGERNQAQVEVFHATFPGLQGRRFFLFISRIHPKKGCDVLLHAFADAVRQGSALDLVVAGPDQIGWQPALERLAKDLGVADRVHWAGMLSGDVKWGAYRAAEVFVLPSHSENFGIVVAEAMACRTPVLITDKVNIWREVELAGAGWVSADDAESFAPLMRRFEALAPEEREGMAARARAAFLQNFDAKRSAQDLSDLIREARRTRGLVARCGTPTPAARPGADA
jgi:glycosyltransferase involved in cell wall biosynthesis